MSAPFCIRGCVYKGAHVNSCPWREPLSPETRLLNAIFGQHAGQCRGCKPVKVAEGTLLCARDLERLRSNIRRTPDLAAHLRSLVDPLKATQYDIEKLSGGSKAEAPAPMNLGAVDAASEVIEIVAGWAHSFGATVPGPLLDGFPSWAGSEFAYEVMDNYSQFLLDHLVEMAKDPLITNMFDVVCGYPPAGNADGWTIQKALDRFPMDDRAYWAGAPCPNTECRLRTVRVTPPDREGQPMRYVCTSCGWAPSPKETFWDEYFGLERVSVSKEEQA